MKLFHGTNTDIETIDLSRCQPFKDFGKGFYLTDVKKQAEYMAIRRHEQTGEGQPTLIEYEFDEKLLHGKTFRIKRSEKPSKAWAQFILANRLDESFKHDFDIVIGPVADDGVAFQLRRYIENYISLNQLVRELTYRKLNSQYYFGTDKAINALIKTNCVKL